MATTEDGTPKTDICEECDREIIPELVWVNGQHEMIDAARDPDEDFTRISETSAVIRWSCACSSVKVEMESSGITAFDVPDEWMWDDE